MEGLSFFGKAEALVDQAQPSTTWKPAAVYGGGVCGSNVAAAKVNLWFALQLPFPV